MSSGKRRIDLRESWKPTGFWRRLFARRGRELPIEPSVLGIDYSLRHRAAVHAVRCFIECIDEYQLQTTRVVQVLSDYLMPADAGLERKVPEWLAERLRFGVVTAEGGIRYIAIQFVDFNWDDTGTELLLHLEEKIEPGTRAFVAAFLGHGDGVAEMQDLPAEMLLGEPG